jgi:hypothetical protein
MANSTTDFSYLAKILYPKGYRDKDLYYNLPFSAAMKKKTDFTSAEGMIVSVDYSLANGIGGTPAGAKANDTPTKGQKFTVPQARMYGYAALEGPVVRNANAGGEESQFINYAKKRYNDGLQALMTDIEVRAFRGKTGSIAQVSTSTAPSGTTITLQDATQCILFRPGMRLVASATDGAATAAGTPGYTTVVSVDPSGPTITVDGTVTTQITGISTSWFLYRYSMDSNNGSGWVGWAGMNDWCPVTPSSSFYGVNQTLAPAYLAGVRTTDTSDLGQLFQRAEAKAQGEVGSGFKTGNIYLHPWQFQALVSSKMNAVRLNDPRSIELGITKMTMGEFTFVKAPHCPLTYSFMVADENMEMHTCGKQPTIGDTQHDVDSDEYRTGLYVDGNILTFAPCQNVRIALPTVSIT